MKNKFARSTAIALLAVTAFTGVTASAANAAPAAKVGTSTGAASTTCGICWWKF